MKTLVIFSMALVATNAFFLPRDFFDDISHRFMDLHTAVRPQQGQSHRPHPPFLPETTNDATHQRMKDIFDSFTPEEQAALKNHLFGERFPRPMPASAHHGGHSKFSDEQIAAAKAKWESMTPAQRQAFREKHSPDGEEIKPRNPRSIKPLPERNERPAARPAHHNADHEKVSDEKIQEIRARWEAMTPEEREAIKNGKRKHYKANEVPLAKPEKPLVRSPRSIQAIKPLPERIETPMVRNPRSIQAIKPLPERIETPMIRNPRSIQAIQPLPEMMDRPLIRNPRQTFQGIQPLPEYFPANPPMIRNPRPLEEPETLLPKGPQSRPGFIQFQPFKVALNPEADYAQMMEKMKGMSEEEQIKYIRGLYPEGMPIRPLKQFLDTAYGHDVRPMPAYPIRAAAHTDEMKIQPYIFPFPMKPLFPLEFQPIFPIPAELMTGADEEEKEEEDDDKKDDEPEFMPY